MPLSQPPGQAQVDFGHAVARIGGRLAKVVFFVMSLVHSDAMFVMAFPRECTEAFLEAHVRAFAFFGFVPNRISYDSTKVAVTQITGVTGLVTALLEAREDRRLERMPKQLARQDLLILDELGYVPFTKAGAELLFEVVSRAYERLSLVVTTNLPFEQWTEVMGSERLTGALLDRLTHRVHIIEANGESYRLQDARKRRKKPKGD